MRELASRFRCPRCGAELTADDGEPVLKCGRGHRFPVIRGVPRFVDAAEYAGSFGRQWTRWSRTQIDSVNGTTIFRDRFARYVDRPDALDGLRVLDAGCGAGAFIDVVAPHAREVVGLDLSEAVDAAFANCGERGNVSIAQADVFEPPLEPASFDLVYCIGVLQHTPDPERAFASLARFVRPGGRLAVWIYERSRWEPLKPRHLLRRVTTRLEPDAAMRFVERYTPRALRVRRAAGRLPGGRLVRRAIPLADVRDYAGGPEDQLSASEVAEWSLMDTHDMLITRYDLPQRPEEVRRWFLAAGFDEPRRSRAEAIAMVGRRRA